MRRNVALSIVWLLVGPSLAFAQQATKYVQTGSVLARGPAYLKTINDLPLIVGEAKHIRELGRIRSNELLGVAIEQGNLAAATALLEGNADPDGIVDGGHTALVLAIVRRNFEMVQLLLAHGADVDYAANQGVTPLMYASWIGNPEAIRELLAHGANPNRVDDFGRCALAIAQRYGRDAVEHVLLGFDAGQ